MTINAVIYARTSPDCPLSAEGQVQHLKAVAADRGWTVSRVFIDRPGCSRKGREKRPGEAALLETVRRGEVQKVLVWSIDRVGRSLVDLVGFLDTCRTAGVGLWLDNEGLDTDASNGLSLFDLARMMGHHLRQGRRSRILAGQQAARAASVKFGRPPLPETKVEKVKGLLAEGKGIRQAGRMAGISAASVSRLKATLGTLPAHV